MDGWNMRQLLTCASSVCGKIHVSWASLDGLPALGVCQDVCKAIVRFDSLERLLSALGAYQDVCELL